MVVACQLASGGPPFPNPAVSFNPLRKNGATKIEMARKEIVKWARMPEKCEHVLAQFTLHYEGNFLKSLPALWKIQLLEKKKIGKNFFKNKIQASAQPCRATGIFAGLALSHLE